MTSLPPITSEVFTEKVLQAQSTASAAATKANFEKDCSVCVRTYFSENAYRNHIGSYKHKAKLAEAGTKRGDGETESVISSTFSLGEPVARKDEMDSEDEEDYNEVIEGIKKTNLKDQTPVASTASSVTAGGEITYEDSLKRCLFCNFNSPSIQSNAYHMEKTHGMFIPEKDYLVDLDGLIGALHEKIYENHECLYCNKLKPSVFGLQTHMRDLGHCKIAFTTEEEQLEIGDYYDFTSTYSDVEEASDSDDVEGKKVPKSKGKRQSKKTDGEGDEDMEEGEGWETDDSASSVDEDEDEESRATKNVPTAYFSEYELHLPTGRTAGHRSLNRYFRQNLHSHPSPAERQQQAIEAAENSDEDMDQQLVAGGERGRAGRAVALRSSAGLVGVSAEKRKQIEIAEKKSRRVEERERRKYQWGNNKQSNMQKHFRVRSSPSVRGSHSGIWLTLIRILSCNDWKRSTLTHFRSFAAAFSPSFRLWSSDQGGLMVGFVEAATYQ